MGAVCLGPEKSSGPRAGQDKRLAPPPPSPTPAPPPQRRGRRGRRAEASQICIGVCLPLKELLGRLPLLESRGPAHPPPHLRSIPPQEGPASEDQGFTSTPQSSLGTIPHRMCLQGGSKRKTTFSVESAKDLCFFFLLPQVVCSREAGPGRKGALLWRRERKI